MPIGSLWDHIRFQASLRPSALAVFGLAGPVGYARLAHDAEALATELLERGFGPTDMVGIHMETSYLHLLMILAFDRLGVPSMSFAGMDPPTPAVIRTLHLTAVVSGRAAPGELPCRWADFAEQHRPRLGAVDASRLAAVDSPPDALVRVIWSSGTTGGAKGSPITRRIQANRIAARRTARGIGPRTRYLTGVPFSTAPGYIMAMAVLAAGGVVILHAPGTDFVGLANTLGATMTSGPPALLASLINAAERPTPFETMDMFMVSGTHLPSRLAQVARLVLTPNLWIGYGATETDGVANAEVTLALGDPSAVGILFPWVEAQVVDDVDRPLGAGQEGVLRLRCDQMVAGYYANEAATRRNFRDGWFYSGDLGLVTDQRLLRITGRVEDVIVRGGVSIAPLPLEEAIRPLAGVRDVAVFPLPNADGSQEICAALVLDDGTDLAALHAAAVARLGDRAPSRLLRVEALPRNANGKVIRPYLVDWALRAASPGSAPT